MANILIESNTMAEIADSIRAKNSSSKQYLPGEMAKGIAAINGNAYQIAVDNGFEGTLEDWFESLKGPKGEPGTLNWGELTDEQRASLKGDKGNQGDPGESAYQVALDAGFEGTREEWLASLVGPRGPKGADGTMSFTDLTDEQRESLRGPAGQDYVLTAADKQEIIAGVLADFPNYEEEEW